MHTTTTIVALLAAVSSALATPVSLSSRQASSYSRAFLTNCWANPGAHSEVDFFASYPNGTFGAATPDQTATLTDNYNYVWEDGGSAAVGDDTFTWTIDADAQSQPAGAEVGSASFATAGTTFTLVKESEQILYQPSQDGQTFDCRVIYGAIRTY